MPKSTNHDFLTFFYCVIAGVALCLLCDLFRAVRKNMKLSKAATFILDVLFFIISALLTFFMQFIFINGEIRWFVIIGEFSGFLSCRCTLSRLFSKLLDLIFKWISKLVSPVFTLFSELAGKINQILHKIFFFLLNKSKNILKLITFLVYNINYYKKRNGQKSTDSSQKRKRGENNGKKKRVKRKKHFA